MIVCRRLQVKSAKTQQHAQIQGFEISVLINFINFTVKYIDNDNKIFRMLSIMFRLYLSGVLFVTGTSHVHFLFMILHTLFDNDGDGDQQFLIANVFKW